MSKINSDLIKNYINKQDKISEQTKKTYTQTGKTLPFNITTSQPTIIKKLNELYDNPNTKSLYLNMIIIVRRDNDLETDKLIKLRNDLRTEIIKLRKENLSDVKNVLPSYENIIEKLNELHGIRYILNYLLITYGLRNKDLNLLYVNKLPENQKDENYLVHNSKSIKLIINDYKTDKSFGSKNIEIKDKKFKEQLNKMKIKDNTYLLPKKNGDKLKVNSFNDKIISLTIMGLGETRIFKILVKHLLDTKNFTKLEELVNSRGTSLSTIMKSYNVYNSTKDEKKNDDLKEEIKNQEIKD
tara:strand:+ start:1040 stop:1933 length:894 start_codon:yes stop_codon:yes gene_type:complete